MSDQISDTLIERCQHNILVTCPMCGKLMCFEKGYLECTSKCTFPDLILPELRIWDEFDWILYLKHFHRAVNWMHFGKCNKQDNELYVYDSWFQPTDGDCFNGSWFENFCHVTVSKWYNDEHVDGKVFRILIAGNDDTMYEWFTDTYEKLLTKIFEIKKVKRLSPTWCKANGFEHF